MLFIDSFFKLLIRSLVDEEIFDESGNPLEPFTLGICEEIIEESSRQLSSVVLFLLDSLVFTEFSFTYFDRSDSSLDAFGISGLAVLGIALVKFSVLFGFKIGELVPF
jgi:hypothetical protein